MQNAISVAFISRLMRRPLGIILNSYLSAAADYILVYINSNITNVWYAKHYFTKGLLLFLNEGL